MLACVCGEEDNIQLVKLRLEVRMRHLDVIFVHRPSGNIYVGRFMKNSARARPLNLCYSYVRLRPVRASETHAKPRCSLEKNECGGWRWSYLSLTTVSTVETVCPSHSFLSEKTC